MTSLALEPLDELPLTVPLPGQFVVLRLGLAPGAPAQMRSYSLSGEPSARRYRISVKRETHGVVSAFINEKIQIGDAAGNKRATRQLHPSARRRPSGPFERRGRRDARPRDAPCIGGRSGAARNLVAAWSAQWPRSSLRRGSSRSPRPMASVHSHIRYSSPGPGDRPGVDFDATGHLDIGVLRQLEAPRDANFFLCGPSAFMSELTAGLVAWGVAPGRVHSEVFGPGASRTPGVVGSAHRRPHLPAVTSSTGPLVSFARSGINVHWGADYQSLLELAEACDVPTRWACRTGVCHTCESGLVAGTVRYRPDPIMPPAPGDALICCSQPQGDVVIDL